MRWRERGFTLVEVMLALAILGLGLGMLLRSVAGNARTVQHAQMLGIATDLARSKMYDIEEDLLKDAEDGFQEQNQSESGDFADEGWSEILWEAEIEKVELPALNALSTLAGGSEGEGQQQGEGGGLFDFLGGITPAGGGAGGAGSTSVSESFLSSQMELLSQILEASIRKVTLTVRWRVGGDKESMEVVCYFTDPGAVQRKIAGIGL